jgi:protein-tyrosine phosphatase
VSIDAWPGERARHGGADEIPLAGVAGRLWLCGKHYVGPDPEHALQETGASTVVCLTEATELKERYPHYVAWLRANQPGRAVWFPIPDLHAPDPEAARPLLDDLVGRLRSGEGLLVHCGAGIGRAGTVAVAILMATGARLATALTVVAAHRAMAGPEAGAQRALLDALAAEG